MPSKWSAIADAMSSADIGTKRFAANRLRSLMSLLGIYTVATGASEGAEDLGHLLKRSTAS